MKKLFQSQWASGFFGLPAEYSVTLQKEIFTLTYHGGGGFIFSEVYGMPVYLRKFFLGELADAKKREKASTNQQKDTQPGQVPNFIREHAKNKSKK